MAEYSIRVVLADDHSAIVMGAQHVLEDVDGIDIVGTAKDSTALIKLLGTSPCHVLVTDYSMPGGEYGDGLALIQFIQRRYPSIKIVVMTMMDSPVVLRPLMKIGIQCIISKSDDLSHLIPAIHLASTGGTYFSPSVVIVANDLAEKGRGATIVKDLSKREVEIVRLFASGLSVTEIANTLNRSKQTISSQKASAMKKLGIMRDIDLYKYAMDIGLLT
jgi:two-component system capsular synthesis response regulator RcsB